MLQRLIILCLLCMMSSVALAQILGTTKTFDFVLSPVSARIAGLGGTAITVADSDVALGLVNPALLNPTNEGELAISHAFLVAGISHGAVSYGKHLDSLGINLHGGIQYITYGEFDLTDNTGNVLGSFNGSEVAITVGASKKIANRISFGVNARWMTASYSSYGSNAIGLDAGLLYSNEDNTFAIGGVIRNAGVVLKGFTDTKEEVRNDIQFGLSKRLKHLPFRFSVTLHNLQQWNIRYKDPADVTTDILGTVIDEKPWVVRLDNLVRHIIFSGEFLLGQREQFRMRFGYNHMRNQELSVLTFRSLTGFSLGFGINIKRFKLDYGVGYYHHRGSATNQLSLRFNPFNYNKV